MNTKRLLAIFLILLLAWLSACQTGGISDPPLFDPTATALAAVVSSPPAHALPTAGGYTPTTLPEAPDLQTTHTPTSLPSATPDIQAMLVATVPPTTISTYVSPDGLWHAEVIRYECTAIRGDGSEDAYEEMRLINNETGAIQLIESQIGFCGGLGAAGLDGVQWSPDSRYFYYTPDREGVPDGCGYFVPRLIRYDIATGESLNLGMSTAAPDGNHYASWSWEVGQTEQWLRTWQMDEGNVVEWSPYQKGVHAGPIAWSADGSEFVYLQMSYQCLEKGTAWVVRVNAETLEQELLWETDTYHLWTVKWTAPDVLTLETIGFENDKTYTYHLGTEEILEIQP